MSNDYFLPERMTVKGTHFFVMAIMMPMMLMGSWSERGLKSAELSKMKNEQRVALIIGNNDYQGRLGDLKNPVNDAKLMRDTLERLGFDVLFGTNVSKTQFKKMIKRFATKLSHGGVGMFYFAGHGIQVEGRNYLIASDSRIREKDDVEFESIAMNYVVKKIQNSRNRFNIVVLDACRNDPFTRSGGGGLAPLQNARGIFLGYATEAGNVALDGESDNSVFTEQLTVYMKQPIPIEEVFKNTRAAVWEASNHEQFPGVYNQALGEFYFTIPKPKTSPEKVVMKTERIEQAAVTQTPPAVPSAAMRQEDEGISSAWYWGGGAAVLLAGGAAAAAGGGGGGGGGGESPPATSGDPVITLEWDGQNDLDLIVDVPCGKRIAAYSTEVSCGDKTGRLSKTSNETKIDDQPQEIVTFENTGGAEGVYQVYAADSFNRNGQSTTIKVTVLNNGTTGTATATVSVGSLLPVMQFTH